MAVAVGVAVVALGAGVVGCLLQPHEHVHLGEEQGRELQASPLPAQASSALTPPPPDSPRDCDPPQRQGTRTGALGQASRAPILAPPLTKLRDLG